MAAVKKYPELDSIAIDIANTACRKINTATQNVESVMPYKSQYVLEEVIKILESRV